MNSKKTGWLVTGALLLASGVSNAEMLTFHFKGTVTYGGALASVGDEVSGQFCYDTDTNAAIKVENYAYYQVAKECRIVVRVGVHKATSRNLSVSITNNSGGNFEDFITLDGGPAKLDGVDYPQGTVGFVLATAPGNSKVFRSVHLREQFRIADFDAGNYGDVRMDGSSNGTLLQFTITSVKVVD